MGWCQLHGRPVRECGGSKVRVRDRGALAKSLRRELCRAGHVAKQRSPGRCVHEIGTAGPHCRTTAHCGDPRLPLRMPRSESVPGSRQQTVLAASRSYQGRSPAPPEMPHREMGEVEVEMVRLTD